MKLLTASVKTAKEKLKDQCTMRYALEKPGGLWYNINDMVKKANKTVNIKKPEQRHKGAKHGKNN